MKIRAITLSNVRRFAGQRARIDQIGDGVTVLSEPNEFGKSTFFDALHALFFERHRSTKSAVKALQPHAGGGPEVEVEVDLPEGRFRLRKRWLSRPAAQVFDATGKLIAQEDEAEAWIDRLLGQGLAGPTGLLWVRQGVLGLEPEGTSTLDKQEREKGLTARRDLLSSVAGEIELMTGGRRMDAVLARVGQELAKLATSGLKPKAEGEWKRAVDEAQRLTLLRDDLAAKARHLSAELARRATATRELQRLSDPEAEAVRQNALTAARRALEAAEAHAGRITAARQGLAVAGLELKSLQDDIARLTGLSSRVRTALATRTEAARRAGEAEATAQARRAEDAAATKALTEAEAAARGLRQRLGAAQKARAAAAARLRAADLAERIAKAETQRTTLDRAKAARALILANARAVAEAEADQIKRDQLASRIAAQSASVTLVYSGALRVTRDGAEVGEGPHLVTAETRFDLPGIGSLRLNPGETSGRPEVDLAALDAALAQKLTVCDAVDLAEARGKLAEAQRLDEVIRTAQAVLTSLAPQGTDALHQALALATAEAGVAPEAPTETLDEAGLSDLLSRDEAAAGEARVMAEAAHKLAVASGQRLAADQADLASSDRALTDARNEAGDAAALAASLATTTAALAPAEARQAEASAAVAALVAAAPDLETAKAGLARAASAEAQARAGRETLQRELAALNGSIGALADLGIEEALDEATGKLAAAEARAARYAAEVQALDRLRQALEGARRAARDAYFGPVLRELEPLLAILHPGAQLRIDDQSLLPAALMRNGQEEGLDILSGGTREQVAILTRLAFARLFAQGGRPVPVILDDALVHSDDDRIEAMFTALHRVARDQQILVLTCRQRAFESLGGARARVAFESL